MGGLEASEVEEKGQQITTPGNGGVGTAEVGAGGWMRAREMGRWMGGLTDYETETAGMGTV